jgi:hypothetical protein
LFDNIIKHSGHLRPECGVEVFDSDGRLYVVVENAIAPWVSSATLESTIYDLMRMNSETSSEFAIMREGGSGFHKLHKLLRHDLDRGYDYNVEVSAAAGVFRVSVSLGMEGLSRT